MVGMIRFASPLPVGNAVRLIIEPTAGASRVVVLRKQTDTIHGWDDAGAIVVYDGLPETVFLDGAGLVNGVTYFYQVFAFVSPAWLASASVAVTPGSVDGDSSVDVLSIVRDRIDLGLQVEVAAGRLNHKNNRILVLTSPPLYDNTSWPVVTIHVNSDGSGDRSLGEEMMGDVFNVEDSTFDASEGWMSQWNIGIIGWSLNPDERIALRKSIKRIVIGNLAVFDHEGMLMVGLQQQDVEDFEQYSAPVYQTRGTLTCSAMSLNTALESVISDLTITMKP